MIRRQKGVYDFVTPYRGLTREDFIWDFNTGLIKKGEPDITERAYKRGFKSRFWFSVQLDDDCFPILDYAVSGLSIEKTAELVKGRRDIHYYYHGWRLVPDYFDENVLLDLTDRMDGMSREREDVLQQLARELQEKFDVEVVGDNRLLSVTQRTNG